MHLFRNRSHPALPAFGLTLLLIAGSPTPGTAQATEPTGGVHMQIGMGPATSDMLGFLFAVSNQSSDMRGFTIRTQLMNELSFFGPSDTAFEAAVLVTLSRGQTAKTHARISVGPAFLRHKIHGRGISGCTFFGCSTYESEIETGVGGAFQVDGMWTPSPNFGLGVALLGHASGPMQFMSFAIHIAFGKVR